MDFNNAEARANLVALFQKARSGDTVGLQMAKNALDMFMDAEAASARFAAAEALAADFLGTAESAEVTNMVQAAVGGDKK